MNIILAITIGSLFATSLYLMLRRNLVKMVIGLGLLSHAANLLIFVNGGLQRGHPPVVPEELTALAGEFANPLPQAMVLTAIVITFGLQAFTVAMIYRAVQATETADMDDLVNTDELT